MITAEEAYNRAKEEISHGFNVKDIVVHSFDYEGKKESDKSCLVTNVEELIWRIDLGDKVAFYRIINKTEVSQTLRNEVKRLLFDGVLWYNCTPLAYKA